MWGCSRCAHTACLLEGLAPPMKRVHRMAHYACYWGAKEHLQALTSQASRRASRVLPGRRWCLPLETMEAGSGSLESLPLESQSFGAQSLSH